MNDLDISAKFIKQLKQQILSSRHVVAKIANAESLKLYFVIGEMVNNRFSKEKWGTNVMDIISNQLQQELPGLRGFSGKNIYKMRQFYNNWKQSKLIFSLVTRKLENNTNSMRLLTTDKIESNTNTIYVVTNE